MTYDRSQIAAIDTETLGLDPDYHPLWEVAVIVDGVEHQWFQKVGLRAQLQADPYAVELGGFNERYDPDIALDPHDSVRRFNELVTGRHLVGACPWFDSERMHRTHRMSLPAYNGETVAEQMEARRTPWHYHLIDVEALAIGYLCGLQQGSDDYYETRQFATLPWKSTELSLALYVDPEQFLPKHTALADARWALAMWEAMMGDPA